MYNVKHHWDPLQTCIVGATYNPEFYSFVNDAGIRNNLETIAYETQEDLDRLSKFLTDYGVHVIRPNITNNAKDVTVGNKILPAPLTPRDYTAVIDNLVFMPFPDRFGLWRDIRGDDWNETPPNRWEELNNIEQQDLSDIFNRHTVEELYYLDHSWISEVIDHVISQGNKVIFDADIDTAMVQRLGDTLLIGNWSYDIERSDVMQTLQDNFPNKECTLVSTQGHLDGIFCVISPELVVTTPHYDPRKIFPDAEIHTVPRTVNKQFIDQKKQTSQNWWLPEKLTSPLFENYISEYLKHWVGEIQETCLDVILLILDPKNVVCSNEDVDLFKVLDRHGITPHVVTFRHQLFWDSGIHCLTSDLDRLI